MKKRKLQHGMLLAYHDAYDAPFTIDTPDIGVLLRINNRWEARWCSTSEYDGVVNLNDIYDYLDMVEQLREYQEERRKKEKAKKKR